MNQKWSKAAQEYEEAEKIRTSQVRASTPSPTRNLKRDELRRQREGIELGTSELKRFMDTDGPAAMELLRASKRHIIFGENNDGGGYGTVYLINGDGLQQSHEAMGTWVAYAKQGVPKPRLSTITAQQAVEAAVYYGNKRGSEVVTWLCDILDNIANSAPYED